MSIKLPFDHFFDFFVRVFVIENLGVLLYFLNYFMSQLFLLPFLVELPRIKFVQVVLILFKLFIN